MKPPVLLDEGTKSPIANHVTHKCLLGTALVAVFLIVGLMPYISTPVYHSLQDNNGNNNNIPKHASNAILHNLNAVPFENVTKLILFTYARGGSTILGRFFSHDSDTFYWFEPLHGVFLHLYGNEFDPNVFRRHEPPVIEENIIQSTLNGIFHCDLEDVPCETRTDIFLTRPWYHNFMPQKFRPYSDCLGSHGLKKEVEQCADLLRANHSCSAKNTGLRAKLKCQQSLRTSVSNASDISTFRHCVQRADKISQLCLQKLSYPCKAARLRTFKVIRLRTKTVEEMLKQDPSIKVIFYTRDPRGILFSRYGQNPNIIEKAKPLCDKMFIDFKAFKIIQGNYSSNIYWTTYEDLMFDTPSSVKKMYTFLGYQDIPDGIKRFIESEFTGKGSIKARNTATRWTKVMNISTLNEITRICEKTIQLLNYPLTGIV